MMVALKQVELADGPAAGRCVEYYTPLPRVLVIATRNGHIAWHDYRRVGTSSVYRHMPEQEAAPGMDSPGAASDGLDHRPLRRSS
jgi:hypothetical protein